MYNGQRLVKNQRFQSNYFLFKSLAPLLALLFLCSCTSTVYDMRQLAQPVVLNNNPFLFSGTTIPPKLVRVDTYSATVSNSDSASQGTDTISGVNTAQLNAFLKIGGEPDCSIRNVTLDAGSGCFFLVFLLGSGADIEATGEVVQIQAQLLRPTPIQTGQSLTNQSALRSAVQK